MSDRTVHARYKDMEIVRYDRSGKWYAEPTIPGLRRQQIPILSAVLLAEWGIRNAGGEWFPRLSGGSAFDRQLQDFAAAFTPVSVPRGDTT